MGRLAIGLVTLFLSSSPAWALPFKCDKQQELCEILTKRWTMGDKVGVFTSDKQLVAIGEVTEIRENKRIVRIKEKWTLLLRSHEIDIITDAQYQNPAKSFTIVSPLPPMSWSAGLGMVNLGVGDSFLAVELYGQFFRHFWRDLSWMGRFHYLTGSGTASDNLGNAGSQDVKVSSFGLSGGVSKLLLPYQIVSIRLDGDLGFSNASVTLSGGFDEEKVLNKRMADGFGLYARGGVAAVWRRAGIQPEGGISFIRIHNSNSSALFIGVNAPIR